MNVAGWVSFLCLESESVLTCIVGKDLETLLERKILAGVEGVK